MEDRRRGCDYRYRERSPVSSSRYRDRSPDRYGERTSDKYRSSRYRNRSRSRSYSRDRRVDRYRSKSRSRSHRRSTSRGRYRSSRSRSPRHKYQSSKHSSSRNRHNRKSKSISRSPSLLRSPRTNKDRDQYRPSTKEELIAPPPPSFPKDHDESNDSDKYEHVESDSRDKLSDHKNESPISSSSSFAFYSKSTENSASDAIQIIETDLNEEDKERIHREMEEKLRLALAKEGKIYPPPKPEASHPVFANDGSFLEIFKKMQEQMAQQQANALAEQRARNLPLCKRRGGKILKTGIVAKSRASDSNSVDPKDFWSIYLQEVKKYKSASCDVDSQTRPLVK